MEFFTETKPRARIAHKCEACRGLIEPGVHYANIAGKFDGQMFVTKQHLECREAEIALSNLKGCYGGEEWIFLNDLDEPDDLIWLREKHPIVFDRLKDRYGHWLDAGA